MIDHKSLKQSMLQASTNPTDPFAIAYLQLCQLSYCDPSEIPGRVAELPPILFDAGVWQCVWGPAYNEEDANLVFAASYSVGTAYPPLFVAVVTRGTDVGVDDAGILEQMWEDLDVTNQVSLPWLINSSALVAGGTIEGLSDIQGLKWNDLSLLQFLAGYLSYDANDNPIVVMTGHSLGGCLTSVLALWLLSELSTVLSTVTMLPVMFAAPTAGNADFADYFQSSFGYTPLVVNSLDAVPFAWQNIDGIIDLYSGCGIEVPDLVYWSIVGFDYLMEMAGVSYAQPSSGELLLTGTCSGSSDWYAEALYQHQTTTYMELLGGMSVVVPKAKELARRPRSRSRLRKRFGPVSSLPIRKLRV